MRSCVHGGRVYWTERTGDGDPAGSVYSVGTAGGPMQTIASDQDNPTATAVDTSGVYWVNGSATEGEVMRASSLGGGAEAIATERVGPHALALNSSAVYWTNAEGAKS